MRNLLKCWSRTLGAGMVLTFVCAGDMPSATATGEADTTLTVARRSGNDVAAVAAGRQTLSVVRTTTGTQVVEEIAAPAAGLEEEMEILPYTSLPEAVRKSAERQLGGTGDYRAARFSEEGAQFYQVSAIRDGLGIELVLSDEGEIVVLTREVPFSRLPIAVQTTLRRQNPDGRFASVQEVTARAYSATYRSDTGEDLEVRVDPAGLVQDDESEADDEALPEGGAE